VLGRGDQAAEVNVAHEAGRQPQVDQVPRVVAQRRRLQQLQEVGQQRAGSGWVAADRQGDTAGEVDEGPLAGVAGVGGLGQPVGDFTEVGQVTQAEPTVSQLGQRPDPPGAVGQLGRGGQ
jgi:hypothetical protein